MSGSITDLAGITVGHASDFDGVTGCTVVLMPPEGAVASVDVRGAAPGTRETALLQPGCLVERINAIFFSGGSAFGLDAAAGVMRFLAEQGRGFPAGDSLVPIVPGAIIFDLSLGASGAYPTPEMAYRACEQSDRIVQEGSVGAGVGATVGNILGQDQAMKGGVGTAAVVSDSGVTVAALAVVNAFGDVMEPDGTIIAGARHPATGDFVNTSAVLAQGQHAGQEGQNTTLVVVATDAELDKTQLKRLACVSHNGLARTLAPAHSPFDGDAVFAVSVGSRKADMAVLGTLGGIAVERAVLRGITEAEPIEGIPAYSG